MNGKADVVIVGTGVAGLFCALNLPENKNIYLITKSNLRESDSYLAQGGICTLKSKDDYDSFYMDTLKAGHFENSPDAVHKMIANSPEIIEDLITYGVEFEHRNGKLLYTKEGAHSNARILYHKDITGQEITSKLIEEAKKRKNIHILENTEMVDLITHKNRCNGVVLRNPEGVITRIWCEDTVLATGGIGGLFENSTNYPHLTGDGIAVSVQHRIQLKNMNYIQIHPTTFYSKKPGIRFLISESLRGEGAHLLNAEKERFVDELLPRDILTEKIYQQMKKEGSKHVWLTIAHLGSETIKLRFPNIYHRCMEEGYDITKEAIPVTPAQHYFMGGVQVDTAGRTSMEHLYAVGETCCNGVHGANRLASNSLLESLVFAKEAAKAIIHKKNITPTEYDHTDSNVDDTKYDNYELLKERNRELVLREIERANKNEQRNNPQIKCG